jgi:hypothetical protein
MTNEQWTKIGNILGLIIITAILVSVIALEVYHFNDCKKVGHTKAYCMLDIIR